jgi:hypothetical protein
MFCLTKLQKLQLFTKLKNLTENHPESLISKFFFWYGLLNILIKAVITKITNYSSFMFLFQFLLTLLFIYLLTTNHFYIYCVIFTYLLNLDINSTLMTSFFSMSPKSLNNLINYFDSKKIHVRNMGIFRNFVLNGGVLNNMQVGPISPTLFKPLVLASLTAGGAYLGGQIIQTGGHAYETQVKVKADVQIAQETTRQLEITTNKEIKIQETILQQKQTELEIVKNQRRWFR